MSGHSKWATTKHKKAVIDAKRGKLFAKLIKNIEVAARTGGADPEGNPTLFDAIQKAKKSSVPNKNIDSAVKRGGGLEAGGADYETIMYEGYGPNGVAVLIECLTDNRNRAASDVRVAMTRNGGSMADPGSVSYLFNRKGVVIVPKGELSEDDVLGAVLDAGAEEVNDLGESFEVLSEATDLVAVRTALQEAGIDYDSADANFLPDHAGRARRRGRAQDLQADRRAGGQRRRAERLRQLRRLGRGHGEGRRLSESLSDRPYGGRADGDTPRRPVALSVALSVRADSLRARCGQLAEGDEGRGAMRVLGVDPGLTRCGVGVVEGVAGRPLTMLGVGVVRTPADAELGRPAGRHRAGHRAVARRAPARIRRRGAGVQPAQRPYGHGHRPGQRRRHALRGPPRHPGRAAHPQRGQGRRHRQRPGRQGAGRRDGHPAAAARRPAQAGRRRRRPRPRHLPHLARPRAEPPPAGRRRCHRTSKRARTKAA